MKTLPTILCAVTVLAASSAHAFLGFGGSSTNKPPKLHVLMQPANDYIEEAQVCELNGDGDKAIEFYKKALEELNKIVDENPERAETAEFAPLRNKAAVCTIQIDAIKLEQVNANERRVAVTDTTELQKKYDAKHGIKRPKSEKEMAEEAKMKAKAEAAKKKAEVDAAKKTEEEAAAKRKAAEEAANKVAEELAAERKAAEEAAKKKQDQSTAKEQNVDKADQQAAAAEPSALEKHLEDAKDAISAGKYSDASKSLVEAMKIDPDNWDARYLMAYVHVAREDYEAADVLFADILEDRPNNVSALLLHAAALMARGSYAAAQKSVSAAIRANPSYYAGYYDMALLLVEMGSSKETAKKYYEAGRAQGGPRDAELEKLLK